MMSTVVLLMYFWVLQLISLIIIYHGEILLKIHNLHPLALP